MADPQKVLVELPDKRRGFIPRTKLDAAVAAGARVIQEQQQPMQASMSADVGPGVFSRALDATGRFIQSAGDVVDPRPVLDALTSSGQFTGKNPVQAFGQMGNSMAEAQGDQLFKARDAWSKGNMADAVRYGMGYLIPLLGPAINHAGDLMAQGKIAEGLGETAGLGLSVAAPAKMQQAGHIPVRPFMTPTLTQAEAAAVAFADAKGIPVDLAMRTGNRWVQNAKTVLQNTLGAGEISKRAQQRQVAALDQTAQQLADQVYPQPVSPAQAGESVRGGVQAEILKHNTEAASAYDQVRQAEADPANARQVQMGLAVTPQAQADLDALSMSQAGKPFDKLTPAQQQSVLSLAQSAGVAVAPQPVMQTVSLPVDLRNVKNEMAPIYQSLIRQMPIAQQRASSGMKAIGNIMDAPDYLPVSLADADLSAIKAAARGADMPELRTLSQGLAARAVESFEDAVQDGVANAGPEVAAARNTGRQATALKYDAAQVLKQMRDEPVQLFQQLTYAGDSGVEFFKQVASQVPAEMPRLGRAYLQGLFEDAMQSGEFRGSQSLMKRWNALGKQTKAILFNPAQVQDINNLMRLAEMQARNPNPSGTAHVLALSGQGALALTNPLTAAKVLIAPAVLAKLMYSPKASRMLTQGFKIPIGNRAAATMAFQNLMAEIAKVDRDQAQEQKR